MSLPRQAVHPGVLDKAYHRELTNLAAGGMVKRLWHKDPSLWPADEDRKTFVTSNLGWLDLPDQIGPYIARVAEFANTLEAEGFEDVVFVGTGDSSLAADTVSQLALPKRWKRIFVLDTTDPAAVRSLEKQVNLERAIFVFAAKSGKRIEGHAILLYFLERFKSSGIADPGGHCIAITEEHSYLAEIAKQYKFRGLFFDPPGISGRYSALIHLGLLLSGLCRFTPTDLILQATSMSRQSRDANLGDSNLPMALAAFLGAAATEGNDRLLLFGTCSLAALTHRVAHLVGASTCKHGRGLIPITLEAPLGIEHYQNGCVAAAFTMRGDEDSMVKQAVQKLTQSGVPCVCIDLESPAALGAELFKWEIATALACAILSVNPFDELDVRESANAAMEMLELIARKRELPARTVRVREAGVELYAEGEMRQQISTLSLADALRTFFESKNPHGYLATLAFLDPGSKPISILRRIGEQIASKLNIPVLLSFGPRYLYQLGQVFHGGPPKGLFVMLTGAPAEDILIPGAGYSFGQLQLALATGDFDTLARGKKSVVRLHLTEGTERGLTQLEQAIQQALNSLRTSRH